jgi:GAF domain-containing protein
LLYNQGGSSTIVLMPDPGLQYVINRLSSNLARDFLVQQTVSSLREFLHVDRTLLYYFYREWDGQVTFESLSSSELSILGMKGPDECFNGEYAAMYQAGRVRGIADIEVESIQDCHRDFLRSLRVRSNLAVPVLNIKRLWGLLIAHHCQDTRSWVASDIEAMQKAAEILAMAPSIRDS